MTTFLDFETWWRELGSAALVGTARRPVPPLPALGAAVIALPTDARAEEALLSSAALGGAARLAGRMPERGVPRTGSGPDMHPAAPRRAVQLLELVLTQPPAGAQQRTQLLAHWLAVAADRGYRLPHALLPAMLETATAHAGLRRPAARVIDARGSWLAAQRADWAWASAPHDAVDETTGRVDPADWARLPSADRAATLVVLRGHDPAAARALVESTWTSDSAKDRRAHLDTLRIGLGAGDETLLERALDDRAASVRDAAADLLDGLPESARAHRMAERLRPLIAPRGVLRRSLEVTLPGEPDGSGRRDGLGKPPPRRSARGWWLERIAAGAPLEVWTTASGADPVTTVGRLSDEDALRGIRRAVAARRDRGWAMALLERGWDLSLVEALPRADRERVVLARLPSVAGRGGHQTAEILGAVGAPWSADFSKGVVAGLRAAKAPLPLVVQSMPHLVAGLHPQALAALEDWLAQTRNDTTLTTQLRHLLQFHSVKRSITEAFT